MKVYRGVDVYIHIFLTLALAEWVVSFTPWPLYPLEGAPGTHWRGGWVDLRTGLDDVKKRKFLTLGGLELRPLGCPARSQSLYRLRYPGSYVLRIRSKYDWLRRRKAMTHLTHSKTSKVWHRFTLFKNVSHVGLCSLSINKLPNAHFGTNRSDCSFRTNTVRGHNLYALVPILSPNSFCIQASHDASA
jgi:hypothetical protein